MKKKPDIKDILDLADRYLNEYLEDLNNGVCQDEKQYKIDCENFAASRRIILAIPKLIQAGKSVIATWGSGDLAKSVRNLNAAIKQAEGK